MGKIDQITSAAARVDFRLTYASTDEPRRCCSYGINGPTIPNSYYGRGLVPPYQDVEDSSGDWEDPEHPDVDEPEEVHIARWFQDAVRESIHEALEWFWVDSKPYLDPHGVHENPIHSLSEKFTQQLLALREKADVSSPPLDS